MHVCMGTVCKGIRVCMYVWVQCVRVLGYACMHGYIV